MPAATAAMGRRWGLLLAAAALAVASCCCQASAFVLPSARPARPPAAAAAAAAATTAPAVVVASRARPAAAVVGPLRSSTDTAPPVPSTSQEVAKDLRTIQEYLNGKHGELLEKFVTTFTPTGEDMRKKNFWRGDAFAIAKVEVESLDLERMRLRVTTKETGMFGNEKLSEETQEIVWSKNKPPQNGADLLRALISMCSTVGEEAATASLYRCPIDNDRFVIPNNLFLNNVPHRPSARQFFYNKIVRAVDAAILDPNFPRRMQIKFLIPESNPAFDSYRIGTVLEMIRELVFFQINCGKRVKVCVQGRLGEGFFQGLPISLNGVQKVLDFMDWQDGEGEQYEGIREQKRLVFGEVGEEHVEQDIDTYILIAPQNIPGAGIIPKLEAMAKKAAGKPFILVNPNLADRPSHSGIMGARGREERMAFADSFATAFAFETLHVKGLYKIEGAVGKAGHDAPWVLYRLEENQDVISNLNDRREEYKAVRVSQDEIDIR